jgi:hypothetical protein
LRAVLALLLALAPLAAHARTVVDSAGRKVEVPERIGKVLNRVIGLKWLAGLFYPDQLSQDLRETTRSFYGLFYHVEPSDAALDILIAWSKGQAPSAPQPRR